MDHLGPKLGQSNNGLSIFIKYYLDKDPDSQLSIDKIFIIKVQALVGIMTAFGSKGKWKGMGERVVEGEEAKPAQPVILLRLSVRTLPHS